MDTRMGVDMVEVVVHGVIIMVVRAEDVLRFGDQGQI
jgi:hypothetical protein